MVIAEVELRIEGEDFLEASSARAGVIVLAAFLLRSCSSARARA
jgi:hypothetical protein